jgi:rSAM/selenodomain-associated transferase 1
MHLGTEQKRLLIMMAKQPRPGHTKTRLSPPLDPAEAAALYECFLRDKLYAMQRIAIAQPAIAYGPKGARKFFEKLAPFALLLPQTGEDLAQSLCNIFEVTLDMGFEQVLAIDGDSPDLPASYLLDGLHALDNRQVDVVIGPTEDGGYYAIGMRRLHRTLFDVEMSTPRVSIDTLAKGKEAGLKVTLLPRWYDVDRADDLKRLLGSLSAGAAERAPDTAAFLDRLSRTWDA